MRDLSRLKLFATTPHDCSYLENQEATTVFVDPELEVDAQIYSQLSELGFRRSGQFIYRPQCEHCQACIASRVPVNRFIPTRRQRRIAKKNADIRVVASTDYESEEIYELYCRYISTRHRDGDMFPPSREQFSSFLSREWGVTRFFCFRLNKKLVAVSVVDVLDDGLSAIYTFFDPDLSGRSPGVFSLLWLINYAAEKDLEYVYLGYWIKDCQKMQYKTEYRPIELYINNRWLMLK